MDTEDVRRWPILDYKLRNAGFQPYDVTHTEDQVQFKLATTHEISATWLTGIVNVFGSELPLSRSRDRGWEFGWRVYNISTSPSGAQTTMDIQLTNTKSAWWTNEQLETLVTLLKLVVDARPWTLDTLVENGSEGMPYQLDFTQSLHVYQNLLEFEVGYILWTKRVIEGKFDEHRPDCDESLYKLRLCCTHHMTVRTQQLRFYEWFMWFLRDRSFIGDNDHPQEIKHGLAVPSSDELLAEIDMIMHPYLSTHAFLKAYYEHIARAEAKGWYFRHPGCPRSRFVSWKCCPMHLAEGTILQLFHSWAEMIDLKHDLTLTSDKEGHVSVGIMSVAWVELLIYREQVDRSGIQFPTYFDESPEQILSMYNL